MSSAVLPQTAAVRSGAPGSRGYGLLFWGLLAVFELWLASLPLIPNGDGPMHIYLASTLWKLATHSSPLFGHYYAIRHLVQPYSFHYYLFIVLNRFLKPDAAEKLFAGLILATVALGFRSLTRALGAASPAAPLLVFPLLLSWPFSAGFFNFTFGCGLLLFALALYTRFHTPGRHGGAWAAFGAVLVLLVLAHPIPILILICLTGLDLLLQLPARRRGRVRPWLPPAQIAALALSCLAFVFPILIADKAAVASSVNQIGFHFDLLVPLLVGQNVAYFQVRNGFGVLYLVLIVAVLPVALRFLFLRRRETQGGLPWTGADRLLIAVMVFLAGTLLLPKSMNGSAFFAVRLWYPLWLLAAASIAALLRTAAAERRTAAWSLGGAGFALMFAFLYVPPVARAQAELEQAPLPPNARGLYLLPEDAVAGHWTHTWWGVNFWGGVRAFHAHGDVLVNTPWMELTILPVEENGRAGLLRDFLPGKESEAPYMAVRNMSGTPAAARALALADFVLVSVPGGSPAPRTLAERFLGAESPRWRCDSRPTYAVCVRR